MLLAADFRQHGRKALRGQWPLAIGTGFVASLLGASTVSNLVSNTFSFLNNSETYVKVYNQNFNGSLVLPAWFAESFTIYSVWALLALVLGGATMLGYASFNLKLVDGKPAEYGTLFSHYSRFGTGFLMNLLVTVFTLLWTLLLIIPGIIAVYSYAMTPYILAENTNMTANEAIAASKELMCGNKWRLFCLHFSFIGWNLLCVLSLGLGYLWLAPYMEAATAAFYREVSQKNAPEQLNSTRLD